jgi:hypothetical protein
MFTRLLLALLSLSLFTVARAAATTRATLFEVVEQSIVFDLPQTTNPFSEIDLDLQVEAPTARAPQARFSWFGFFDGDGRGGQKGQTWKFRLNLDTPGRWTVTATFRRTGNAEPLIPPLTYHYEVAAQPTPGERGHIRRDPRHPLRLAHADGTPWIPFPLHASFLLDQTPETSRRWLDEHAKLGVNALGVRFHAEAHNALGVPGHWHFLTPDGQRLRQWPGRDGAETAFDYTRLDLASWHHNEAILAEAQRLGIRLHLWFGLSGDNRQYRSYGPQDWSADGVLGPQQSRFIRHFLARWAPLPVWWHWTVDSEYEEGPGDDLARDRAWAAELQRLNPWPTLVTTHVLREWTPGDAPEYDLATLQLRVPADPARLVSESADFVRRTLPFGLPVFNAEGVWMLPPTATRLATLAHLFAGGSSHVAHDSHDDGSGHSSSSWGCDWDQVNPRHREDAAMLGALARFFNTPEHAALRRALPSPARVSLSGGRNALCLTAPGEAIYLWLDEGGTATVDLTDLPGTHRLTRYLGPDYAGSALDLAPVAGGARAPLPPAPQTGYGRDTLYLLRPIASPPLALLSPSPGARVRPGGETELRWLFDPSLRAVRIDLSTNGGAGWTPLSAVLRNTGSARVRLPDLPPGPILLRVVASKRAPAPESRVQLTLEPDGDTTPPELSILAPGEGARVGPSFTVIGRAADEAGLSRVELRIGAESAWRSAEGLSAWSLPLGPFAHGPLRLEIRAVDLADPANTSDPLALQLDVDAAPPVITELAARRETGRVVVTWRTDEPASSRVQWGPSATLHENDTGLAAENVTEHRVILPSADGPIHLVALSSDPFGNTSAGTPLTLDPAP